MSNSTEITAIVLLIVSGAGILTGTSISLLRYGNASWRLALAGAALAVIGIMWGISLL